MYPIKTLLIKLAALLFFFTTSYAYSGAYVMPVDIKPKGEQANITLEIVAWTENDDEYEGEGPNRKKKITNPCYGATECYVGPDVLYNDPKNPWPGMQGSCKDQQPSLCLEAHSYRTVKEVMEAYKEKVFINRPMSFDIMTADAECVGLFYTRQILPGRGNARIFPNSTCNKLPPPNQSCAIELPTEIAYGELKASEVNNKTGEITGSVKCSLASKEITLHVRSKDGLEKVNLDANGTIFSTLQISGQNIVQKTNGTEGVTVIVPKNNDSTTFTLTSTLHTNTPELPKAGKYEGTAVVLLTYN
ncbi:MAG: pilus assembly protein [Enterobacteriaceae bacterium]|jgi:hypothetical protein|nr:pilus assembly protein [Enterobacteriaceae bacterium]